MPYPAPALAPIHPESELMLSYRNVSCTSLTTFFLRSLNLVVPRDSLCIRRWHLLARSCLRLLWCRRLGWLYEAVLLSSWKLRIRCAIYSSVLSRASLLRSILWLSCSLYVVVCDMSSFGVFLCDLVVGWIGRCGDDVPGV